MIFIIRWEILARLPVGVLQLTVGSVGLPISSNWLL